MNEITTHETENNDRSQAQLDKGRAYLNRQCRQVLDILMSGNELDCRTALIFYSVGHLPRRIADLKQNGVIISSRNVPTAPERPSHKVWYMTVLDVVANEGRGFKS